MTDIITSKDNKLIKNICKLMSSAKARKEQECFVAEGVRLCMDAVLSKAKILYFLYTPQASQKNPEPIKKISDVSEKSYMISEDVYEKITDTKTPQGFLCVIKMDKDGRTDIIEAGKKYLGLEKIQDPSNMGTVLRTAEALGIDGVIMSSDCCDIYSPKVIRGSMGAVFRLPFMISDDITKTIIECRKKDIVCYASTPKNAENIKNTDFSKGGIIFIGNEGNGLSEQVLSSCDKKIMISMKGRAESLNASAAAAILLYEFMCRE